jgi:hypothetical protein
VESGHLNVFNPYQDKPLHHEDQLTRAFLILMRSSAQIRALFLELVCEEMRKEGVDGIPPPLHNSSDGNFAIETQVKSTTKENLTGESGRLVSILISDSRLLPEHRVERNDRKAVYDGFIKYGADWAFVIENKPNHKNAWMEQLSSRFHHKYEIEPTPIKLVWAEIMKRLNILSKNDLINGTAKVLVADFLDFTASHFPEICPFDKLSLCEGDIGRLTRRCNAIMQETNLGRVKYHRNWYHSIRFTEKEGLEEIALYPFSEKGTHWKVGLELHPGDTMNQAREFYKSLGVSELHELQKNGWFLETNFHVAYQATNLHYGAKVEIGEYVGFWKNEVQNNLLNQIPRAEWQGKFEQWQGAGIISDKDLVELEQLKESKRQVLNVCPGLSFFFTWSSSEAMGMDDKNEFVSAVQEKINEVLSLW